jgi:cell division protein FtsI/penicillin-binding protein 2
MDAHRLSTVAKAIRRTQVWYAILFIIMVIFGVRLFYVQVIRYQYYHTTALSNQLKQYQIPATRGIIEAHEGNSIVPIVLNQPLYTLYADPTMVKDVPKDASIVTSVIGGNVVAYQTEMLNKNTRYVVLGYKLTATQDHTILSYKLPGIGTQELDYRTYPQGSIASQLLGFVNNSGQGEYGIEQALNTKLSGTPGTLKAITDANGVPLVASSGNIETQPIPGDNVVLTLDMGMQTQMETILQNEAKSTKSHLLSAVIMDPNNGQIKAMANCPTYNPSDYESVTDPSLFLNAAVDNPIEPGSSMKTLTTSAALDQGVIQPNTTFYDPAHWVVDGFNITDIEQDGGPRVQSIASILSLSLNTGATWMLMQMGGGQINAKAIEAWHNYMVNRFRLGQPTGIEQGYEAPGYVPPADLSQPAIDLTYANTTFGQGVTLTALQLGAAFSSVLNGGTYYQPTLVDQTISADGKTTVNKPKILETHVVSPNIRSEMIPLLENVVTTYYHEGFSFMNFSPNYIVGGKTGTAQIASPAGGYYPNLYNGTYIGFVGGNKVQYLIVVFNIEPTVPGYAGAYGGQPVFADLAHMLINDGYVAPKST